MAAEIRAELSVFGTVVRARQGLGLMLGIRQPLDGPIFEKLEHAEYWCWYSILDHFERGIGMSDAIIEHLKT